ncbi:MAG: 2-phospho-L-lactate transferase [Chloroflexi bacterium]|nr:2-phospho-L-lactate transferase [Chloroflexota bacterium]
MALKSTDLNPHVVALAGGVGGAKLAHGLARILPSGHLTVIVNTGDDFAHRGLHISPDLDTVMYTLGEIANPKTGWGLDGDTFQNFEMMEHYGVAPWFRLGDRDLATHFVRTEGLKNGQTLTQVTQQLSKALGIQQSILPATDDSCATVLDTQEYGRLEFQEYFVKFRWQPTVVGISYKGEGEARVTDAALESIAHADLVVICPSNPLLSVEPILRLRGMREAIQARRVPCVALSPLIDGKAVKGPAAKLMGELNLDASVIGIATYYAGLIDGLVIDTADGDAVAELRKVAPALSLYVTQTLMETIEDRERLAGEILKWDIGGD